MFASSIFAISNNTNDMNNYTNLNDNEISVLQSIVKASDKYTGGDFTYFKEVMEFVTDFNEKQVKGYLSQLAQKNYVCVSDDKFCQICPGQFVDFLTEYEF
jgi:hypothetical protein